MKNSKSTWKNDYSFNCQSLLFDSKLAVFLQTCQAQKSHFSKAISRFFKLFKEQNLCQIFYLIFLNGIIIDYSIWHINTMHMLK